MPVTIKLYIVITNVQ